MDLSKYLAGKIATWLSGTPFAAAPTSLVIALSNGDPRYDASNLAEPADSGYARQTITFSPPVSDDDHSAIGQTNHVVFTPSPGGAFGHLTHVAVFDNSGNMLFSGPLAIARTYGTDETVDFLAGTLKCNFTFYFTSYIGEAVLNWMNGTTMPTAPTGLKMGLFTDDPGFKCDAVVHPQPNIGAFASRGGAEIQNYVRQRLTFATPEQTLSTGTKLSNATPLLFGPADTAWGRITHWAIFSDAGAMLINGSLAVPKEIPQHSGFGFETGSLVIIIR